MTRCLLSLSLCHTIPFLQLLPFFCSHTHTHKKKRRNNFQNMVSDKTLSRFNFFVFPSFVSAVVCHFLEASHPIFLLITFAWFRVRAKLRANSFPVQTLYAIAEQFFTDSLSNVWWMTSECISKKRQIGWKGAADYGNKAERYRESSVEMETVGRVEEY